MRGHEFYYLTKTDNTVYLTNSSIRPSHCFRVDYSTNLLIGSVLSKKTNKWSILIEERDNPYIIDPESLKTVGYQPNTLDPFLQKLYLIGCHL